LNVDTGNWHIVEQVTFQPLLYIESPYKEQLEEQVTINDQLEKQLYQQQATNKNITNMMFLFGVTTLVFAAVTVLLVILNRRTRVFSRPIVYSE